MKSIRVTLRKAVRSLTKPMLRRRLRALRVEPDSKNTEGSAPSVVLHGGKPFPLLSLPTEILVLVLCNLDLAALLTVCRVSRMLFQIIQEDVGLQYNMALEERGMINRGVLPNINLSERLDRLHQYASKVQPESATYTTATHLRTDETHGWWEWQGTIDGSVSYMVRTQDGDASELVVHTPACAVLGASTRHWSVSLRGIGEDILRATVDASQDLAAVVERVPGTWHFKIHLLSLETGAPHPYAAQPVLHAAAENDQDIQGTMTYIYNLRIFGCHLAWSTTPDAVNGDSSVIEIWDWTSGSLTWHRPYYAQVLSTFLDDRLILLSSRHMNSLSVHQYSRSTHEESLDQSAKHEPLLRLGLPPVPATNDLEISHFSSGITPGHPGGSVPFEMAPGHGIVAVYFSVIKRTVTSIPVHARYILIISQETIRRLLSSPPSTHAHDQNGTVPRVIDWDDWGPSGAFLLDSSWVYPGLSLDPFGSRFPLLIQDGEDGGEESSGQVVILDFHHWAAKRALYKYQSHMAAGNGEGGGDDGAAATLFQALLRGDPTVRSISFGRLANAELPCAVYPGPRIVYPEGHHPESVSVTWTGFVFCYEQFGPTYYRATGYQAFTV